MFHFGVIWPHCHSASAAISARLNQLPPKNEGLCFDRVPFGNPDSFLPFSLNFSSVMKGSSVNPLGSAEAPAIIRGRPSSNGNHSRTRKRKRNHLEQIIFWNSFHCWVFFLNWVIPTRSRNVAVPWNSCEQFLSFLIFFGAALFLESRKWRLQTNGARNTFFSYFFVLLFSSGRSPSCLKQEQLSGLPDGEKQRLEKAFLPIMERPSSRLFRRGQQTEKGN